MKAAALVVLGGLLARVQANTPLHNDFVNNDIKGSGGLDIAKAARPMWHFGKMIGQTPCYPTWAVDANGAQAKSASLYAWPRNGGGGCADPGPLGQGNPFPVYWSTNKCSDTEIRVLYNLYYQKDGYNVGGHAHDWERVIVVWNRNGDWWTRTKLLKSFHSTYREDKWAAIQNTVQLDNIEQQGAKDLDHPKVYCGAVKHAHFTDRKTGFVDIISQSTDNEYRSNDWWFINDDSTMIGGGRGSPMGDVIATMNWGSATSPPPVVQDRVCTEHA